MKLASASQRLIASTVSTVEAFLYKRGNAEMGAFNEIRNEILNSLEMLARPGEDMGSGNLVERAEAWKEKLYSDHFRIVVMGQFKRGKTTLINSILGYEVLPSSVIPLTSVNTLLRYGEEPRVEVRCFDERRERHPLERLAAFVTEQENPENRLGVRAVEVFMPSEYLREGYASWTPRRRIHLSA